MSRPTSRIIALTAVLLFCPLLLSAQQAGDGFKGAGAAVCVAAGEQLSSQPKADPSIRDGVQAWRQILHVMEGTEAQRQAALDSARAKFAGAADAKKKKKRGPDVAAITWSAGCATREMQIKYLAVHGSQQRTIYNLAEEPGTTLDMKSADRVNQSASCLGASEQFPDAPEWKTIGDRSRKEIDAAPGSVAGKALVVDYFRFLYKAASTSNRERFLNQTAPRVYDQCRQ